MLSGLQSKISNARRLVWLEPAPYATRARVANHTTVADRTNAVTATDGRGRGHISGSGQRRRWRRTV